MQCETKNSIWLGIGGLAIGLAAGLLLAPQSGRRSRALIRDKAVRYSHDVRDFTDKKSRHLANKVRGYFYEARGAVASRTGGHERGMSEEEVVSS